ncbi:MAG: divalent metal cation transporter [Bacteroidota bacterium]
MVAKIKLSRIIFWSVISAAFIGPGTVTTAASSGANFGLSLLWALTFSTFACFLLQEAAARIPLASGLNLGQALVKRYGQGHFIPIAMAVAIIMGGIAYQAGNILGSVSGAVLLMGENEAMNWTLIFTLLIALLAAGVLLLSNIQRISRILGLVVAAMGFAFIMVALGTEINWGDALINSVIPSFPEGSGILIIGLIGTTIVPYNLFLGSGMSRNQDIREMRWGLGIAIILGGMISMAILLVGSSMQAPFSFEGLAQAMKDSLGDWAAILFAIGLIAAGFTSSVTAPLAAAITAQSIFSKKGNEWGERSRPYIAVWAIVLLSGMTFGVLGVKPIPIIILAQALNGLLLPFVAAFLLLVVNDKKLMPAEFRNSTGLNLVSLLVVGVSIVLGLNQVMKASFSALSLELPALGTYLFILIALSILICLYLAYKIFR